jgi:hypothetical protein
MRTPDRISRHDRHGRRLSTPVFILIGLLVVVAGLLAIRIYWERRLPAPKSTVPRSAEGNLDELCDSLLAATYASFNLNEAMDLDRAVLQTGTGGPFREYHQGWPAELPFILFAQRLTAGAAETGLGCDCLESSSGGWMDCALAAGRRTGGRIRLQAGIDVNLASCEIAVVLENFGSLTSDEISSLLKSGMALSYMASLETFPSGKTRELISKKGIFPLLVLPATSKGWVSIIGPGRSGRDSSRRDVGLTAIDKALDRHPGVILIYFDLSDGLDSTLVEAIIRRAKAKKMGLLLSGDRVENLTAIASLSQIKTYYGVFDRESMGKPLDEVKSRLIQYLIGDSPTKMIICPDATDLTLQELWEFKVFFEKLGVKFRPPMRLMEPVEAGNMTALK